MASSAWFHAVCAASCAESACCHAVSAALLALSALDWASSALCWALSALCCALAASSDAASALPSAAAAALLASSAFAEALLTPFSPADGFDMFASMTAQPSPTVTETMSPGSASTTALLSGVLMEAPEITTQPLPWASSPAYSASTVWVLVASAFAILESTARSMTSASVMRAPPRLPPRRPSRPRRTRASA